MINWLTANSGAATALAGIAAIVTAVVAVATLAKAWLDGEDRKRPYIIVEYQLPEYISNGMFLVVRNGGLTAARELTVTFDKPFEDSRDVSDLKGYIARRYEKPIAALGPGQALTSVVLVSKDNPDESDVPAELRATVVYKSPWWRRKYSDTFQLQRTIYTQQTSLESPRSLPGRLESVASALNSVADSFKSIPKKPDCCLDASKP